MALLQHEPPQDPSAQPWASLPLRAAGPEARAHAPHHSPASSLLLLGPGDWNPSPQTSSLLHLARECAGASREGERWGLREQVPGWGWRHRLRLLPAKVRAVSERIRGPGHCPRSRPAGWVVTSWWVSQPWDCRQHGVGNSPPVDCRGGAPTAGGHQGMGRQRAQRRPGGWGSPRLHLHESTVTAASSQEGPVLWAQICPSAPGHRLYTRRALSPGPQEWDPKLGGESQGHVNAAVFPTLQMRILRLRG